MRHAIAAAAFLAAGCNGPLLSANVDVPHIGVTLPSQDFAASDTTNKPDWCDPNALAQSNPPCIQKTVDYDLGSYVPALTQKSVTYDLRLTEAAVTLTAANALTDLSGVESATVRVGADPNVPGSGTVIASYVKPSPTATPTSISVSGDAGVDLGPYLASGHLPVRVELVMSNGVAAFAADVYAGFSIVITVDWGSYL